MRANDEGNFPGTKTFKFKFSGRSVFKLRNEVATQVDEDMFTITLFFSRSCMSTFFIKEKRACYNLAATVTRSYRGSTTST
jgi:hypothetical protein